MRLTPALLTCVLALTLSQVQGLGQDVADAPGGPAAAQPASPVPQHAVAAGELPHMEDAAPSIVSTPLMDDSLLIDNGLWDGADIGPCCAICGGGNGCPPDWYTEQGVRIFGRSRAREILLGSNLVGNALIPELNTRSASPDVSLAYATTIGHYFARDTSNRDNFIEFSYWGLNGWKDEAQASGNRINLTSGAEIGNLFSGFFNLSPTNILRGFDGADVQTTFYSSYEHNFELNGRIVPRSRNDRLVLKPDGRWRRECQPGRYMSYLYGLRFMQLHETFRFHSQSTIVEDSISATYTGDYDVVAHNNLLAIQVGAEMTFRQCRWTWGIRSKLGPGINFSDQVSVIASPDLDARLSAAKHEASLLAEVGFQATYKFRPNLMGRAAWDFMWISGVALAPEQIQFVADPLRTPFINKINTNGLLFQHGLSLGLEWMW